MASTEVALKCRMSPISFESSFSVQSFFLFQIPGFISKFPFRIPIVFSVSYAKCQNFPSALLQSLSKYYLHSVFSDCLRLRALCRVDAVTLGRYRTFFLRDARNLFEFGYNSLKDCLSASSHGSEAPGSYYRSLSLISLKPVSVCCLKVPRSASGFSVDSAFVSQSLALRTRIGALFESYHMIFLSTWFGD